MARIELHNYQIHYSDGAGNEFMATDRPVRWKPKTKREYDRLCGRIKRIGGRRRTARQRKKYNRALRGKLSYEGLLSITRSRIERVEELAS